MENTELIEKKVNLFTDQIKTSIEKKKSKQIELIEQNPFVKVEDEATYKVACKHRTNLRTGRTSLEGEKKSVVSLLKKGLLEKVSEQYDQLISITTPYEETQQKEIKEYEAEKEAKKQEKIRLEEERISNHRNNINTFIAERSREIQNLKFSEIETYSIDQFVTDPKSFEEFEAEYISTIERLKFELASKIDLLKQEEANRIEAERIEAERKKEFERQEALRLDQVRKDKIKSQIEDFKFTWEKIIEEESYTQLENRKSTLENIEFNSLDEFEESFNQIKTSLLTRLDAQVGFLKNVELSAILERKNHLYSIGFDNNLTMQIGEITYTIPIADLKNANSYDSHLIQIKELQKPTSQPEPVKEIIQETKEKVKSEPIPLPSYTPNQIKSMQFIDGFIDFCFQKYGMVSKDYITEYVLLNVKK